MENEIWKDIPDYEGYYQASNLGKIRSLDRKILRSNNKKHILLRGKVLKPKKCNDNYLHVSLLKDNTIKYITVHRLIALTFIKQIKLKKCVNHINSIRYDNRLENLEWVNHKENTAHMFRNNRNPNQKGEKHGMSKLTNDDILEIRLLYEKGIKQNKIAEKYKVSKTLICKIVNRLNWNHI